jgi:hypothetical protein
VSRQRQRAPMRPVRVYRLSVLYPAGSETPGWEPEGWEPDFRQESETGARVEVPFSWPVTRLYLSRNAAVERVALLVRYGAKVSLERSDPVQWPTASEAGLNG